MTNPFSTSIVRGIEDVANETGRNVILCNGDENEQKAATYLRLLFARRIDGPILAPSGNLPQVLVTDLSAHRLAIARECGLTVTANARDESLEQATLRAFGEHRFDVAIECVGAERKMLPMLFRAWPNTSSGPPCLQSFLAMDSIVESSGLSPAFPGVTSAQRLVQACQSAIGALVQEANHRHLQRTVSISHLSNDFCAC